MKISALLTCHNREHKTKKCLDSLVVALKKFNDTNKEGLHLDVYLTDDGCTDCTVEKAKKSLENNVPLHIVNGDGCLYWAGGMRACWKEAIKQNNNIDYYLLLNDDVELYDDVLISLINTVNYSKEKYGTSGIVSGITCDPDNEELLTYGGDVWVNKILGTVKRLEPNGSPQLCDMTNANILLVPAHVVDRIGIFYEGYQHGQADYDYAIMARKNGIPVVLTANFCGKCPNDHVDPEELANKIVSMTFKERKAYFSSPVHSSRDYMQYIRRATPLRLPIVWIGRMMNLLFPKVYYRLSGIRNI